MAVYTVHEPPMKAEQSQPDPERFVFVRDGFSFWAFLLPPLWMLWHRLWLMFLGYVIVATALQVALNLSYTMAQAFGWNWSENQPPKKEARFSLVYTIAILVGALIVVTGIDPLQLTILSMVLTAATLPISIVPFLVLMNDKYYVKEHGNGWFSNAVLCLIIALALLVTLVAIPLQIFGGR